MEKRKILILGRVKDKNLGDSIIVDTCAYALQKIADEKKKNISITCLNLFTKDIDNVNRVVKDYDAVVFPGGGVNSAKFTTAAKKALEGNDDVEVFFNASGVSKTNNETVVKAIKSLFNKENVVHITTRGDFETAKKFVKAKKNFPVQFILDPAIFTSDTYGIKKNEKSDVIGVGLIRPGIFKENGRDLDENDVMQMYLDLLRKLDERGEKWQLFCNGTMRDYEFAQSVLENSGRSLDLLAPCPAKNEELVKLIAGYKGIIASRFHANIIATSLRVPTVALVWNDKMLGFAELTGCRDRYITDLNDLQNAETILNKFDEAMATGFDEAIIGKAILKTKRQMAYILGETTFERNLRLLKKRIPKNVKVIYRKIFKK